MSSGKQTPDECVTAKGTAPQRGTCYRCPANTRTDYRLRPIVPVEIALERAAQLFIDPEWWMQESRSGHHMLIRKTREGIDAINEEGNSVALPTAIELPAEKIRGTWIIEGVCIGDTFVADDLLEVEPFSFRSSPYWLRFSGLRKLLSPEDAPLRIAGTAMKTITKAGLLKSLRGGQSHGLVFRKSTAVRAFEQSPATAHSLKYCFREPLGGRR